MTRPSPWAGAQGADDKLCISTSPSPDHGTSAVRTCCVILGNAYSLWASESLYHQSSHCPSHCWERARGAKPTRWGHSLLSLCHEGN